MSIHHCLTAASFLFVSFAVVAQSAEKAEPVPNQADVIRSLEESNARRQQKIAELEDKVAKLEAQLFEFGIRPVTSGQQPTTVPSTPKRIVYVRLDASREAKAEIQRSVAELEPQQYFNLVTTARNPHLFSQNLVPATEFNKKKFEEYSVFFSGSSSFWLESIAAALRWQPDVIWVVGMPGDMAEEEAIAAIKKFRAGGRTVINTTVRPRSIGEGEIYYRMRHLAWRIAHEFGGKCIDENGLEITEPGVPVTIELPKPPPPAEPPSKLR